MELSDHIYAKMAFCQTLSVRMFRDPFVTIPETSLGNPETEDFDASGSMISGNRVGRVFDTS
jgi:hypothetical protein